MAFEFTLENDCCFTNFKGTRGTMSRADVEEIIKSVKGAKVYAETGSYLGLSSLVAATFSNAMVYAHDIWVNDWSELKGSPPPEHKDYFYTFYKMVKDNSMQSRIIPVRGDSKYTLGIHDDDSIDCCFIDGDHSYEGCLGDLVAVYPKMKKRGGIILIHDCYNKSETLKATNDFCKANRLFPEKIPNSCGMHKIIVCDILEDNVHHEE